MVLMMSLRASFPAISGDGMKKLAGRGEDIMVSGICGGGLLAPLFGVVAHKLGGGTNAPPVVAGIHGIIARQVTR